MFATGGFASAALLAALAIDYLDHRDKKGERLLGPVEEDRKSEHTEKESESAPETPFYDEKTMKAIA
ncbi:uncharacterized protein L201_003815 [Kwoniella dendrophila CBS 6074]|uniref:Uncharacterized protein n=1 Tax=Kwoniella dendrophila CBS 6074 TaxID=1295534 RepID=A0AAX4JU03_9TREE